MATILTLAKKREKNAKVNIPLLLLFLCTITLLVITKGYGVRATTIECQMRKFRVTYMIVKTPVIRLRVIEGPNARDQIAFCAFHSTSWKSKMINAGYIHATREQ